MKALTIHQPFATLIALGEKRFETRGWVTKYRGPIAIHAAKKVVRKVCLEEPFRSVLAKHGYTADNLPTGAVVATATLAGCHPVLATEQKAALIGSGEYVEGNELAFGWYEESRYAWEVTEVKQIDPVPAKGQQGLWNWMESTNEKCSI